MMTPYGVIGWELRVNYWLTLYDCIELRVHVCIILVYVLKFQLCSYVQTDSVIELESAQSTPVLSRRGQPQTVPTQREKFKHKRVGTGILSRKQGLKFQFEPQKLQSFKRHCKSCRPEDEVCLNLYCELQPERRREDGGGTQESNP